MIVICQFFFIRNLTMSTEVEKEITVVIPSSKVADPEFIQQEVTKAKLRVLIEVHKGSDKSLYELIKEFLPDIIENKTLLREFNISTESKTEFKLKLATSDKKPPAEKPEIQSELDSKPETEAVQIKSEQESKEKSPKTKISIKPKKIKAKPKIKISKKVVSKSSPTAVKDKVESPIETTDSKTEHNSGKEKPSLNTASSDETSSKENESIATTEQSKPKKKKILKVLKKKPTKD